MTTHTITAFGLRYNPLLQSNACPAGVERFSNVFGKSLTIRSEEECIDAVKRFLDLGGRPHDLFHYMRHIRFARKIRKPINLVPHGAWDMVSEAYSAAIDYRYDDCGRALWRAIQALQK